MPMHDSLGLSSCHVSSFKTAHDFVIQATYFLQIDWVRETQSKSPEGKITVENIELIATGKKVVIPEKRYRVFR